MSLSKAVRDRIMAAIRGDDLLRPQMHFEADDPEAVRRALTRMRFGERPVRKRFQTEAERQYAHRESPFERNSFTMLVSREMLLDMGEVKPTPEEHEARHASLLKHYAEARQDWAMFDSAQAALDALDGEANPIARRVLDLHSPAGTDDLTCTGCEFGGWEGEAPAYPCATVRAIAEYHGIDLPDYLGSRPPAEDPPLSDLDEWKPFRIRDLMPESFVTMGALTYDSQTGKYHGGDAKPEDTE